MLGDVWAGGLEDIRSTIDIVSVGVSVAKQGMLTVSEQRYTLYDGVVDTRFDASEPTHRRRTR